MSMEEVRWKAVFPGIEVTSSILQCKFPPFSAKLVHPSVNLPVGNYVSTDTNNNNTYHSLIVHATDGGQTWTEDTADEADGIVLLAIDGDPSSGDAWAVGYNINNSNSAVTLHLVSGHFTDQPNINSNAAVILDSVSEYSSTDIWAVGYHNNTGATFTMHWEQVDGTYQWVEKTSPNYNNGYYDNYLQGVTDIGPGNAWAVGTAAAAYTGETPQEIGVLMHWDGSAWSTTPLTVNLSQQ